MKCYCCQFGHFAWEWLGLLGMLFWAFALEWVKVLDIANGMQCTIPDTLIRTV